MTCQNWTVHKVCAYLREDVVQDATHQAPRDTCQNMQWQCSATTACWLAAIPGLCSPLCIDCTDSWAVLKQTNMKQLQTASLQLFTTAHRRVSRVRYHFSLHRVGLAASRLAVHIDAAVVPGLQNDS